MMSGSRVENGEVLVAERVRLFDGDGRLAEDCAEIWGLIKQDLNAIARAFWERYASSPDVSTPISAEKFEELVQRI